jgi:hypothetical protein
MSRMMIGLIGMLMAGLAMAKLPPASEEAKAQAAAAKDKADWSSKVAAYQLCMTQDRIAAAYLKSKGGGKTSAATPACRHPGAYVVAAPAAAAPPKK